MTVEEARLTLGKRGENLSDDELTELVSRLQQLAEFCLDSYEKKAFGKTLAEMEQGVDNEYRNN